MGKLYDKLNQDIRYRDSLNACINCGTCTAICPAAEFYKYDPRQICDLVQQNDEKQLEDLLKSDTIWYCGECMSCVTRCPKSNKPGLLVIALRSLSQEMGYFVESEKGRQQLALKRTVGDWILEHGYCVYPRKYTHANHPESGTIWQWEEQHLDEVYERLGANLDKPGPGAVRKIPQQSLDELHSIFEVTGGLDRFNKIEECSKKKAEEMGLDDQEYFDKVFTENSENHYREE